MKTQNAIHIQEPAFETLNPQFAQLDVTCETINTLYPGKTNRSAAHEPEASLIAQQTRQDHAQRRSQAVSTRGRRS